MHNSNYRLKFPRTSAEAFGLRGDDAVACRKYKTSLSRRFARLGLDVFCVLCAVTLALVLASCDSPDTDAAVQADLNDAIAQARADAPAVAAAWRATER